LNIVVVRTINVSLFLFGKHSIRERVMRWNRNFRKRACMKLSDQGEKYTKGSKQRKIIQKKHEYGEKYDFLGKSKELR